jgi:hypothetical protein
MFIPKRKLITSPLSTSSRIISCKKVRIAPERVVNLLDLPFDLLVMICTLCWSKPFQPILASVCTRFLSVLGSKQVIKFILSFQEPDQKGFYRQISSPFTYFCLTFYNLDTQLNMKFYATASVIPSRYFSTATIRYLTEGLQVKSYFDEKILIPWRDFDNSIVRLYFMLTSLGRGTFPYEKMFGNICPYVYSNGKKTASLEEVFASHLSGTDYICWNAGRVIRIDPYPLSSGTLEIIEKNAEKIIEELDDDSLVNLILYNPSNLQFIHHIFMQYFRYFFIMHERPNGRGRRQKYNSLKVVGAFLHYPQISPEVIEKLLFSEKSRPKEKMDVLLRAYIVNPNLNFQHIQNICVRFGSLVVSKDVAREFLKARGRNEIFNLLKYFRLEGFEFIEVLIDDESDPLIALDMLKQCISLGNENDLIARYLLMFFTNSKYAFTDHVVEEACRFDIAAPGCFCEKYNRTIAIDALVEKNIVKETNVRSIWNDKRFVFRRNSNGDFTDVPKIIAFLSLLSPNYLNVPFRQEILQRFLLPMLSHKFHSKCWIKSHIRVRKEKIKHIDNYGYINGIYSISVADILSTTGRKKCQCLQMYKNLDIGTETVEAE